MRRVVRRRQSRVAPTGAVIQIRPWCWSTWLPVTLGGLAFFAKNVGSAAAAAVAAAIRRSSSSQSSSSSLVLLRFPLCHPCYRDDVTLAYRRRLSLKGERPRNRKRNRKRKRKGRLRLRLLALLFFLLRSSFSFSASTPVVVARLPLLLSMMGCRRRGKGARSRQSILLFFRLLLLLLLSFTHSSPNGAEEMCEGERANKYENWGAGVCANPPPRVSLLLCGSCVPSIHGYDEMKGARM